MSVWDAGLYAQHTITQLTTPTLTHQILRQAHVLPHHRVILPPTIPKAMGNCIFFFRALFYVLATMAAVGSLEPVIFPKDVGQSDSIGFTIAPYTVLFVFNGVTLLLTLSVSGFDNAMLVALNNCRCVWWGCRWWWWWGGCVGTVCRGNISERVFVIVHN